MMDSIKLRRKQSKRTGPQQEAMVEGIYKKLNQGGLYEIYQIMDGIEMEEEKQALITAFITRYKFNFMNHI